MLNRIYSVRGATTADANDATSIGERSEELVREILRLNRIGGARKIVHIVFSTTDDLTAAYPATAVRLAGLTDAPLFSCKEPAVDGALPLCIRALVLIAEYDGDETPPAHVYLHGAKKLRPDLTERNE